MHIYISLVVVHSKTRSQSIIFVLDIIKEFALPIRALLNVSIKFVDSALLHFQRGAKLYVCLFVSVFFIIPLHVHS